MKIYNTDLDIRVCQLFDDWLKTVYIRSSWSPRGYQKIYQKFNTRRVWEKNV